ncbi:MAG: DUF1311 domain-containing protein [Lachnospiraceae bacterium]|nr:DUF1311 domain-containing protein [Lachnospiraceae bacterium]
MMKKRAAILTAIGAAGLLCGAQMNAVLAEEAFSYENVSDLEFYFSSGAGAWWTELQIHEDGTFEGHYQDADMGDSGDDYPNGTVYICDFSGQFSELVKVNEYIYSTSIQEMALEKETDTTEIIDGIRYISSEPYGLYGAERILFYLAGAPLEELPEEYRSWVGYYDYEVMEETELPFVGIYNEAEEQGFSSFEKEQETGDGSDSDTQVYPDNSIGQNTSDQQGIDDIQVFPDNQGMNGSTQQSAIEQELAELAEKAAEMENQIQEGMLSQQELNQLSGELYVLWDDELNSIWRRIKEILPQEEMAQLTAEELQWIDDKEKAVAEAGAEFEGGSMQPYIENTRAADITRTRVYELADYLR